MITSRRSRPAGRWRAALLPPLLALIVLAIGCAQPLSPADVAGRYALQRVGGDPLPVAWPGPADAPQRLLADQFVLGADGSAQRVMRIEELQGAGAPRTVEYRDDWVFEIDGNRVNLRRPPCTTTDCAASGARMEFHLRAGALVGLGGLVYQRMGAAAE